MTKADAIKRLDQIKKICFDRDYQERKQRLFNRIFRNKDPLPVPLKHLNEESGHLIRTHLPEIIDDTNKY